MVDVNTGKFTGAGGNLEETVTRNNLEAAEEIVRQMRLRDIGGMIVIDFIDMVLESNRDLVLRRLTESLGRDRTRHQVSEVTSLGLVRSRARSSAPGWSKRSRPRASTATGAASSSTPSRWRRSRPTTVAAARGRARSRAVVPQEAWPRSRGGGDAGTDARTGVQRSARAPVRRGGGRRRDRQARPPGRARDGVAPLRPRSVRRAGGRGSSAGGRGRHADLAGRRRAAGHGRDAADGAGGNTEPQTTAEPTSEPHPNRRRRRAVDGADGSPGRRPHRRRTAPSRGRCS